MEANIFPEEYPQSQDKRVNTETEELKLEMREKRRRLKEILSKCQNGPYGHERTRWGGNRNGLVEGK